MLQKGPAAALAIQAALVSHWLTSRVWRAGLCGYVLSCGHFVQLHRLCTAQIQRSHFTELPHVAAGVCARAIEEAGKAKHRVFSISGGGILLSKYEHKPNALYRFVCAVQRPTQSSVTSNSNHVFTHSP